MTLLLVENEDPFLKSKYFLFILLRNRLFMYFIGLRDESNFVVHDDDDVFISLLKIEEPLVSYNLLFSLHAMKYAMAQRSLWRHAFHL